MKSLYAKFQRQAPKANALSFPILPDAGLAAIYSKFQAPAASPQPEAAPSSQFQVLPTEVLSSIYAKFQSPAVEARPKPLVMQTLPAAPMAALYAKFQTHQK